MPNVLESESPGIQSRGDLEIALPAVQSLGQDAEWCLVRQQDRWRRIRFHDYEAIYEIPGLYEKVIYDILECRSPRTVRALLERAVDRAGESMAELRCLDLGAGNGMMAELLKNEGVPMVVGIDIVDQAADAAERDRPGVYENYHVLDLTRLSDADRRELRGYRFNCLTCVAALGFGDIPPEAFAQAFALVALNGWIAFNIKEDFLKGDDDTGFDGLIRGMIRDGVLEVTDRRRYQHRLGIDRHAIHYVAIVGRKREELPGAAC